MFQKKKIDSYFYTLPGFYLFHIPVKVPYRMIHKKADQAGLKRKPGSGPILEKAPFLGFGWIGVEVESAGTQRSDLVHVSGAFDSYEHKGPYKTLGQACQKIKKERPNAELLYSLYLDDPAVVRPEDCRTQILFRSL